MNLLRTEFPAFDPKEYKPFLPLSRKSRRQLALGNLVRLAQKRRTPSIDEEEITSDEWCATVFPNLELAPGGERHKELWGWTYSLKKGERQKPFIAIWPRGSGKSTTAELSVVFAGATKKRRYAWYVSASQALADLHIESIASLIESQGFSKYYPSMSDRKMGKFGNARGWRRNRLRCANGFTVDALGLDVSVRGMKIEEQRPDFIILDDIDDAFASAAIIQKRIDIITSSVLPAGSPDLAVLGIQNLIRKDGFFGRIVDGTADYLTSAIVSGPYPAIDHLITEFVEDKGIVITGGEATWPAGQSLALCQEQIRDWGLTSFLREAQHDVRSHNSLFAGVHFQHVTPEEYESLSDSIVRVVVVVDPAVTSNDNSDSHGIAVSAIREDDIIIHLYSVEKVMTPAESIREAILLAVRYGSREVHVEVNQGGAMWEYVFNNVVSDLRNKNLVEDAPSFFEVRATSATGGKVERAQTMLADYERGVIYHLTGTHDILEDSLLRFPEQKPFDLVDATVHAHTLLRKGFTRLFA